MLRIALLMLALVLGACASAPVSIDYDAARPVPPAKTYALVAPVAEAGVPFQSLDNNRIEAALRQQLGARKLQEVARDKADILLVYRVEQQRKLDDSGFSVGFGVGSGNLGLGMSTGPAAKEIREGVLVVDVVDPSVQQVVWSARANRYLQESMKPEQRSALINELVAAMLASFPQGAP